MKVYYNEYDPVAAAWLRELIRNGHLPEGDVDERSIVEVSAADVAGYGSCHFFAGIGGWPLALRIARWPDERSVWTGSCPCQPFSSAGKQKGQSDERHIWPEFARLIGQRSPSTVFGEQVASNLGREWLSGVRVDLETLGYAVGCADLCAAGASSPHIRQRLFWVADAEYQRSWPNVAEETQGSGRELVSGRTGARVAVGLAKPASRVRDSRAEHGTLRERDQSWGGGVDDGGGVIRVGNAAPERRIEERPNGRGSGGGGGEEGCEQRPWDNFDVVPCRDGKGRRVESGTFPLAYGIPARVGRLRGYGNAIVPQVAALFIRSFMEVSS